MNVSIVIATYNRAQRLRHTLARLEDLEIPSGSTCEVLVVDNNSTDQTQAVITQFVQRRPRLFRYVREDARGKSAAMNHGIREAAGDLLVFTDDDCIPDPRWVAAFVALFDANPALGVAGGRVELFDAADRPVTVRTSVDRTPFTSLDQLFSLIAGCNMAFRRRVLEEIGLFDEALGPGKRIAAAEDCDLLYRAFAHGEAMVYAPEPLVYHNHGRRTDEHVRALTRHYVIGRGAFYAKHVLTGDRAVLKMAYWEIRNTAIHLMRNVLAGSVFIDQARRILWLARGAAYGFVDRNAGRAHPPLTTGAA